MHVYRPLNYRGKPLSLDPLKIIHPDRKFQQFLLTPGAYQIALLPGYKIKRAYRPAPMFFSLSPVAHIFTL